MKIKWAPVWTPGGLLLGNPCKQTWPHPPQYIVLISHILISYLCDRYDWNQLIVWTEIFKWDNLDSSTLWLTVSKALFKSRNTAPTYLFLSSWHFIFSMNMVNAVSVEWCGRNPNYMGCKGVWLLQRNSMIYLETHFCIILEVIGRMLIVL